MIIIARRPELDGDWYVDFGVSIRQYPTADLAYAVGLAIQRTNHERLVYRTPEYEYISIESEAHLALLILMHS